MENGSNIPDSSVSCDNIINADNAAEENLNHQRCTFESQNEYIDSSLQSTKKKIQRGAHSGSFNGKVLCSKMILIIVVCCIIGCYLIPIIFYYVSMSQTATNAETDPGFSHEINTSAAKVCCIANCTHS